MNRLYLKIPKNFVRLILQDGFQGVHIPLVRIGSALGVMVIVIGNGHGDTSSNPGQDGVHFT